MMQITVPAYVRAMLGRCTWSFAEGSEPGHTIALHKRTPYCRASTVIAEARRLAAWADRHTPGDLMKSRTLSIPEATSYCDQCVVLTIYDPVMRAIEKYIAK